MDETILRSEAWRIIDSGQSFNLEVVSGDLRRKTGGKYYRLTGWTKRKGEPAEEAMPGEKRLKAAKDPGHHKNKTCVIYNPHNREVHPMTIHWRLIQYLNRKRIING
jgi:hypothetical protein